MPNPFDKGGATKAAPPRAAAAPAKAAAAPSTPPRTNGAAKAAPAKPAPAEGFDSVDAEGQHVAGAAGDPFSTPPGVSDYKITDLVGALMLVKPTEVIPEMDTDIGQADNVIRADVILLEELTLEDSTELAPGTVIEDILVFQMALKRALNRVFDGPNPFLLGRLGMGNAKKGKSAPYIFERPTEDDAVLARQYLASVA